jgi:hypothetical protein
MNIKYLNRFLLYELFGILASRMLSFAFPLNIVSLEVYHSHLGMALLLLLSIYAAFANNKYNWLIPVTIGFVFDGFIFLIVKADYDYWSIISIISALLFAFLFSLISMYSGTQKNNIAETPRHTKNIWLLVVTSVATIGAYRGGNQILLSLDIPNDERSTFIMGYEIHHICYGILVCAFVSIMRWAEATYKGMGMVESCLLGFAIASTADQLIYYMLPIASDEAYFSSMSIVSGVIITIIYLGTAMYLTKRCP